MAATNQSSIPDPRRPTVRSAFTHGGWLTWPSLTSFMILVFKEIRYNKFSLGWLSGIPVYLLCSFFERVLGVDEAISSKPNKQLIYRHKCSFSLHFRLRSLSSTGKYRNSSGAAPHYVIRSVKRMKVNCPFPTTPRPLSQIIGYSADQNLVPYCLFVRTTSCTLWRRTRP